LMAIVAEARANGFPVEPNLLVDAAKLPITGTDEGTTGDGEHVDAFTLAYNQLTHMPKAWQLIDVLGVNGLVRVAFVDSGFATGTPGYTNPDFPSSGELIQWDVSDSDDDASGPGQAIAWHGTEVAGIAGAYPNNGAGTAGTGGQVIEMVLLRVAEEDGRMSWYDVAKAIHQSVGLGAEIVNLSMAGTCEGLCQTLGGLNGLSAAQEAIALAEDQGMLVIGAAGNGGPDTVGDDLGTVMVMPCAEAGVLCVGALEGSGEEASYTISTDRAEYSNYGIGVDLWAPGWARCTMLPDQDEPPPCVGTSISAPYVAGIAAMAKAINPELTGDEIADILIVTTQQGGTDPDVDAQGVVDAYAALIEAAGGGLPADIYEPNNTSRRAAPLTLTGTRTALSGFTLHLSNDVDTYGFRLDAAGTVTISIQYAQSFGDLAIILYDAAGSMIAQGVFQGWQTSGLPYDQQVITIPLTAGDYVLLVQGTGVDLGAYDLLIGR
jgi:hypothetical protein